ncbi:MAG: hypothetical protein K8S00_14330 [Bacteroidales bacterium]|nr:hypothetical protein [Bacteroidales bacterium]
MVSLFSCGTCENDNQDADKEKQEVQVEDQTTPEADAVIEEEQVEPTEGDTVAPVQEEADDAAAETEVEEAKTE